MLESSITALGIMLALYEWKSYIAETCSRANYVFSFSWPRKTKGRYFRRCIFGYRKRVVQLYGGKVHAEIDDLRMRTSSEKREKVEECVLLVYLYTSACFMADWAKAREKS